MKAFTIELTPQNIDRIMALRPSGHRPAPVDIPEFGLGPWLVASVSQILAEPGPDGGYMDLRHTVEIEAIRPASGAICGR